MNPNSSTHELLIVSVIVFGFAVINLKFPLFLWTISYGMFVKKTSSLNKFAQYYGYFVGLVCIIVSVFVLVKYIKIHL